MSDSDNEIGAFLTGFIIGGLVGAAVALITAAPTRPPMIKPVKKAPISLSLSDISNSPFRTI